jgi:hypothetical protein
MVRALIICVMPVGFLAPWDMRALPSRNFPWGGQSAWDFVVTWLTGLISHSVPQSSNLLIFNPHWVLRSERPAALGILISEAPSSSGTLLVRMPPAAGLSPYLRSNNRLKILYPVVSQRCLSKWFLEFFLLLGARVGRRLCIIIQDWI